MPAITNPRQTILVSCRGNAFVLGQEVNKDNIITLSWHMPASFKPNLYAIAIGKSRFSAKLIGQSKVFCVNFAALSMEKEAALCGRNSGEHMDKFEQYNILKEECEKINCPRLREAIGFMECEVINEIESGDHIIFIGKVLNSELKDESAQRLFQIAGTDFTTTK